MFVQTIQTFIRVQTLEGSWQPHRIVVIEFPNLAAIKAWYNSSEYAPLLAFRQPAAHDDLVAVEGI
jgi:uncharacterized protein (DUF1330 family)